VGGVGDTVLNVAFLNRVFRLFAFLGSFFIVMYVTLYKISPMQILKIIVDV
jgi:hypothetical protein